MQMIINIVTLMYWISFIIYMSIIILYICIWVLYIWVLLERIFKSFMDQKRTNVSGQSSQNDLKLDRGFLRQTFLRFIMINESVCE